MASEVSVHYGREGGTEQRSSRHGREEAQKKKESSGQNIIFKDMPPVAFFLQLGSTPYLSPSPYKVTMYESIKGFIHWLGRSPHDLIISGNTLTDTPTHSNLSDSQSNQADKINLHRDL
jgi:hypothetical protein